MTENEYYDELETMKNEPPKMKVFVCTDFEGHWPVGTSAVIVAENEEQARQQLIEGLKQEGLWELPEKRYEGGVVKGAELNNEFTLQEIELDKPTWWILNNGNY